MMFEMLAARAKVDVDSLPAIGIMTICGYFCRL